VRVAPSADLIDAREYAARPSWSSRRGPTIERDMVQVRLTDAFRFVVVGAPSYLSRQGRPERPEDLLRHECIGDRSVIEPRRGRLLSIRQPQLICILQ
jgi:DNA-binding transcriptional LysR family regulator